MGKGSATPPGGGALVPGDLVAQPHGGSIKQGGNPGNRGGPGRPPNELRARMRELGWAVLEETIERVEASRVFIPDERELGRMKKADLIALLVRINSFLAIKPKDLKEILDVSFKYGVGTKVEVEGGDKPIKFGVMVLPQLDELDEEPIEEVDE